MAWFFALLAATLALTWWCAHRRFLRHWRHLESLLGDLADARTPGGFVFANSRRFSRLAVSLERIAQAQERMRGEISRENFNLRTILASMEEGVMVVDAQHVLRLVNESFRRLFEVKADPIGQSVLRVLREAALEEIVTAALHTGEPQTREVAVNGTRPLRHFAVYAVPVRDQLGALAVVTIFRDVSRLKQLEDVRRDFVANVSHELRTPLSIFHGYLENLLDEPRMPRQEQAKIFEVLRKHSLRLNALLQDLLSLARLESRADQIAAQEIDVQSFFETVRGDWAAKLEKKNIALVIDVPPDLPRLFADPLRLVQVMNNLLENALKYTEPGGKISLRALTAERDIVLRVEDTGLGIPPADLPHIFERFYRADKARSREQGGTGLGLSIVKHIVQSHGGTVTAESTYGRGTAIVMRWAGNSFRK